jgi:signal peptidase complex subunit 3
MKNARGVYSVYDHSPSFDGQEATIHLEWNVQPYIGALIYGETVINGTETFVFPPPQ